VVSNLFGVNCGVYFSCLCVRESDVFGVFRVFNLEYLSVLSHVNHILFILQVVVSVQSSAEKKALYF
jgi:hypothetical protein